MLQGMATTSGQNIYLPYFIETYGWARPMLLNYLTIGALVAVVGAFFFPQLVKIFGPRKVSVASLILGGASLIWFGHVSSIPEFLMCTFLIFIMVQGWAGVTTQTLISNWFPRRKGFATGVANTGLPMASVVGVPVLTFLVYNFGFIACYNVVGGFMIALGVVSIFWLKDNPEEVGLTPDNDTLTPEQMKVATERLKNFKSKWTLKNLLRDRNAWLFILSFGIFMMVNRGMLSQFIPYFMEKGYTREQSATYMSLFALFALVGTNVWGFIDQKHGTKKATLVYCLCYGFALILLFLPYTGPVMFVGFALFHFNQGATAKMLPSMAVQCYGRYEFPSVMRLLQPFLTVLFALAPWFTGFATAMAGSIAKSPIVFTAAVAVGATIFIFIKPAPRTDINYDVPIEQDAASSETKI